MRVPQLLCALVVGALAVAACGTGGGGAASTDAGLKGDPIKVGQIAPTGTPFYNAPDSVAVAKAAVRGVNQRGGLNGRPLELVYCNDQGDPNKAAACARQMVSEHVVAVVRSITIAGGDQVSAILHAGGIPDIGRGALVPAEFAAPNADLLDGGVLSAYAGVLQRFAQNGGKRVFFAAAEGASATTTLSTLQSMAAKLGLAVAGTATVAASTADYAPFIATVQQSGAEAVLLAYPQQMIVQSVKAADQAGLAVGWLLNGGGITQQDLTALPAAQTARMIVGTGTMQLSAAADNPTVAQMKADIEAQFGAGDAAADPTKLFSTALIAWESVHVLDTLMEGRPTVDAASVSAALAAAKDLDVGISAPWTPSRPGPAHFPRVSHPFVHLNRVEGGRLVSAQPEPVDVGALMG
jgi:ABC-type branched-subunit amino acid transport system substrate-binding protein